MKIIRIQRGRKRAGRIEYDRALPASFAEILFGVISTSFFFNIPNLRMRERGRAIVVLHIKNMGQLKEVKYANTSFKNDKQTTTLQ